MSIRQIIREGGGPEPSGIITLGGLAIPSVDEEFSASKTAK